MDDFTLRSYIDELFYVYDSNRTGRLEPAELSYFFNDLFQRIGDPRRLSYPELMRVFQEADTNQDCQIDKPELFRICKILFARSPYLGSVRHYEPAPPTYSYTYLTQRPAYTTITTTTYY